MFYVTDLPQYRCHKVVRAAKIAAVEPNHLVGGAILYFDEAALAVDPHYVVQSWVAKHAPQVGGYLVCYDDGYESYSPAAAFEAGYTLLTGAE
jgi:hypothetical protein